VLAKTELRLEELEDFRQVSGRLRADLERKKAQKFSAFLTKAVDLINADRP